MAAGLVRAAIEIAGAVREAYSGFPGHRGEADRVGDGGFGCSGAEVGPVYPSPLRLSDACPYGKTLSRATVDAVLAHADR